MEESSLVFVLVSRGASSLNKISFDFKVYEIVHTNCTQFSNGPFVLKK